MSAARMPICRNSRPMYWYTRGVADAAAGRRWRRRRGAGAGPDATAAVAAAGERAAAAAATDGWRGSVGPGSKLRFRAPARLLRFFWLSWACLEARLRPLLELGIFSRSPDRFPVTSLADAPCRIRLSRAGLSGGYRLGSLKCWRGPAVPGRVATARRLPAGVWRSCGAASGGLSWW